MPFPSVQQKLVGVEFNDVDTVRKHALGIELDCDDGTRRKYVRAGGTIALGDALTLDAAEGHYDYHPTSAADQPVLGVAVTAVADNAFFWAIVRGKATVKVAAAIVAGTPLVPTAVAGTLDDTAAAVGNALAAGSGLGVIAVADDVPSAGLATVVLH